MLRFLAMLYLALVTATAPAESLRYPFSDPALEARFKGLLHELRCLVCQNQTLADSDAELAADLRQEVHRMLGEGASDGEIIDFMVARYGEFVLYRPVLKPETYPLWYGPVIFLVLGGAILLLVLRQRRRAGAEPSPADLERVKRLLDSDQER